MVVSCAPPVKKSALFAAGSVLPTQLLGKLHCGRPWSPSHWRTVNGGAGGGPSEVSVMSLPVPPV